MKRLLSGVGLLAIVAMGFAACAVPTAQLPQYMVDPERLTQSPPAPIQAAPSDQFSEVVVDKVKIDPTAAVGYQNLPTTLTMLYDGKTAGLSLNDAVVNALANNRSIKIEGYTLRIAEYDIPVSKSIYDLMTLARMEYGRIEEQIAATGFSTLPVNSARTRMGQVGLAQLLPTGATIQTAYSVIRNAYAVSSFGLNLDALAGADSIDDLAGLSLFNATQDTQVDYQQRASIGITQPLLKGFGPSITNAGIKIAQLERQGVAADFQTNIENTMLEVVSTYWRLIGAIEQYKVNLINLSAARDLLRINEAKFREGVIAKTDVLQAEAAAQARSNQVIIVRQNVRDLEDRLKRLIFLEEGNPAWTVQPQPTQPFAWRDISVDLEQTIQVALERRPELRRAQSILDQADINIQVAKNALLPSVDLFAGIDTNGLDGNYDDSMNTMSDGKYTNYNVGVAWSYPLQNRSARYRLSQAKTRKTQFEEGLLDLQDRITQEVRQVVRDLETSRERIDVTQAQVRSEEAKLADELKRYDVGISTAFEVLTFQEDLATAQSQHLDAVVDYNIAAMRLERARGTLLDTYGIEVIGTDLTPPVDSVIMPVGLD